MRVRECLIGVNAGLCLATPAHAHVSEGAFILLLPTETYRAAGVAVVALTVLLVLFASNRLVEGLFASGPERTVSWERAQTITSLFSFAAMLFVLWLGMNGPRDPLSNLLPLSFWTVGWVALVSLCGFFGNIWLWLNPWSGFYAVIGRPKPIWALPESFGFWPAVLLLIGFAGFLLADIAPDDPARLSQFLGLYWFGVMVGLIMFGPGFLDRCELGHAIMEAYGRLAPVFQSKNSVGLSGPGANLIQNPPVPAAGVFAITLLAIGSFDGLNETFWWLGQLDVNPLEFPGRSAVVRETWAGLIGAAALLLASVAFAVWLGLMFVNRPPAFWPAFNWLGLSLLPIALAYHIAHYLPSFLVQGQYVIAAMSDPFAKGWDLLGIEPFRVTTGFFNRIESVRVIWLTQAGAVVIGHVWSILLSHAIALKVFGNQRDAVRATLPLSVFMIAFTMLGLWLLAAPKGA